MADIGRKIRYHLDLQRMTVDQLAQKSGLPKAHVNNVIYNKSTKWYLIDAIAEALGVSSHYLTAVENESPLPLEQKKNKARSKQEKEKEEFDPILYSEAFIVMSTVMQEYKIKVSKALLDSYAYDTYQYALKHNLSPTKCRMFAEGMIYQGIKVGALSTL